MTVTPGYVHAFIMITIGSCRNTMKLQVHDIELN